MVSVSVVHLVHGNKIKVDDAHKPSTDKPHDGIIGGPKVDHDFHHVIVDVAPVSVHHSLTVDVDLEL